MEKGLKLRHSKIGGEVWLTAIATSLAIFLAVAAALRVPEQSTHDSVMTTLRTIDLDHASLQRDVLQTRAGLLRSYDPLVESVVSLRSATAKLKGLFFDSDILLDENVELLLSELIEGIAIDESLVEQFKTRNVLLQNSTGLFGQTLTALHQSADGDIKLAMSQVGDLGNLMMRFAGKPEPDLEIAIRDCLRLLMKTDASLPNDIHTLLTHAEMILTILPMVDAKISAIQASGTPTRAQNLQARYLNLYGQASTRSAWSRLLLGITAISLCLYVFHLVYRLRNQAKRLKRRLDYEGIISVIKSEMANLPIRDFTELMERALNLLAQFFEAEACEFCIVNTDRGETEEHYWPRKHKNDYKPLFLDVANALARKKLASHLNNICLHHNLHRAGDFAYIRESTISGIIMGMALPDGCVGTLLIRFNSSRSKAGMDELALMQVTIRTLIEFIESKRSRQEKEALESRLEHAQRLDAVGALAGGIAHEFNNVLQAILGYGEMALQILRKPSSTRHYVEQILSSGERAKRIVDQILTYSRKRDRASKPFDVLEAISDVLPLLQVTLSNKVELKVELIDRPAVIIGNPVEIHQIVMNLCKNAMEASARGQNISMTVALVHEKLRRNLSHGEINAGSYVCVAVRDSGPGISQSVFPHIFEPFFSTKSKAGGTGLGLSAVHGAVMGMGGGINVLTGPELGTCFELFFPLTDLRPVPIKSFFDEQSPPLGRGQTIILVEKDRLLLEMYEEKIAALGYEPVGFSTLDHILHSLSFEEVQPELVILDLGSLETLNSLMQIKELLGNIPQLFLIDRDSNEKVDEEILLKYTTLKKPFSSQALAHAIFDRINFSKITP